MKRITILIADDHTLVRETWTLILNSDSRFEVIGECESGEEAIDLAERLHPDIVILDINLPGMNGFEAAQLICKSVPRARILAVSAHTMPSYAKEMFKNGASGYLTKNSGHQEMFKAIMSIYNGEKNICEKIRNQMSEQFISDQNNDEVVNALTVREIEIINLIEKGDSSKEIATALNISLKTVEVHRHNILRKLKLKNSSALVDFMHAKGLGISH